MKKLLPLALSALGFSAFIYRSNHRLEKHFIEIRNERVNSKLRIVHLSDCHIPYHTVNLDKLVKEIKVVLPDLIVITGDLLDRDYHPHDLVILYQWIDELTKICNVITCDGNHDDKTFTSHNDAFTILRNDKINLKIHDTQLEIVGVIPKTSYPKQLNPDVLSILLDHYPQNVALLSNSINCYQFSGHVHGGQFRFFDKGVFGPNQGFFPKFSKGFYRFSRNSGLIVSAGLGASSFPLRLNNPNHLIVVDFLGLRYNKQEGDFYYE